MIDSFDHMKDNGLRNFKLPRGGLAILLVFLVEKSRGALAFTSTPSFHSGAFIFRNPLADGVKVYKREDRKRSHLYAFWERIPQSCRTRSNQLEHLAESSKNRYPRMGLGRTRLCGHQSENSGPEEDNGTSLSSKPTFALSLVLLFSGVGGSMLLHASAYSKFFTSVMEMKQNASSSEEFASAMTFWFVAAILHPILQPIFAISEILHGNPIMFVSGMTAVAVFAVVYTEWFATIAVTSFLSFLVAYAGSGLEGENAPQHLLADYNIALDDPYQGKIVKGCPTYEQVRQHRLLSGDRASNNLIDNFDLQKYAGIWYWQKVHDWTQFKEVYDTTLDIKINDDQTGYINKLSIKGPSPSSSPYSWDKSPLAIKGAQYFWSGSNRVAGETEVLSATLTADEEGGESSATTSRAMETNKLQPGYFMEKGFGVKFPNYIMDIQTYNTNGQSKKSEQYDELIQFQCIEVGGVRLYEGIDFMSREPILNDMEIEDMHRRAKNVGLNAYGASPEQMHRIERRISSQGDGAAIDNAWQRMWKAMGVEQLLDQLAQSEDI